MRAHRREPDVLADGQAQLHAAKRHRIGQRTRREQPLLVERAVIGQFVLGADRRNLAAFQQRQTVVQQTLFQKDAAHQHRRTPIRRGPGQPLQLFARAPGQGGLENEVLGRIADQLQLGIADQIGVWIACPHRQHRIGIARQIAQPLRHLGHHYRQGIAHNPVIGARAAGGNMIYGAARKGDKGNGKRV